MKISLFHLLLIAAVLSFIVHAGNDKAAGGTSVKTRKDLISRVWRIQQVVVNNSVDQSGDFKNSRLEFSQDGKYTFSRKTGKVQGTWDLAPNEQKLILDKGTPDAGSVEILILSENQLYLSFAEQDSKLGAAASLFKLSL